MQAEIFVSLQKPKQEFEPVDSIGAWGTRGPLFQLYEGVEARGQIPRCNEFCKYKGQGGGEPPRTRTWNPLITPEVRRS